MARILVTAALGNVGREVARECADRGFAVRVGARDEAALRETFPQFEPALFDFLDSATWVPALRGCDGLFLLRPPPIGDMTRTLCPLVDVAYATGVKHIVFLSVAGADKMEWVPHRKVELHLMKASRGWTILRPGFFMQNLQDAYKQDLVESDRIYVPAAQGRIAFIDVRDIAAVAARVFEDATAFQAQALTLTGGTAVTFAEVAQTLTAALGRQIRYVPASIPGYAWHLRRHRRMPWMQIVIQTILHVGLRRGDAEKVDPTVARVLGTPPRTVAEYVQYNAARWGRSTHATPVPRVQHRG